MPRWSRKRRAAYEAEREALSFVFFFFFERCNVFQSGRKLLHGGTGNVFLSKHLRLIFIVFAVLLRRAVLSPSYIQQAYRKKKRITLPGVCTYVRYVSERSRRNRPRREAYAASELFFHEVWRRGSWPYQVASLQLQSFKKTTQVFNHGPLSALHNLMHFSFLGERSGRRRPPAERSALYPRIY